MELIKSLETEPRGVYTGSVGYWGPNGDGQFNVAIRRQCDRCGTWSADIWCGGGIVWDSDAVSEYAETLAKAEVLLGERPDFDLLETVLWTPEAGVYLLERHRERRISSELLDDRLFPIRRWTIVIKSFTVRTARENINTPDERGHGG